jgi:hypothetical protein
MGPVRGAMCTHTGARLCRVPSRARGSQHADLMSCGCVSRCAAGERLLGRSVLPEHPLSHGLSFQAAEGAWRGPRVAVAVAVRRRRSPAPPPGVSLSSS